MIRSMTGFGGREIELVPFGKICVELRSTNHKFLEIVVHMPEGFLSLEERIKKEIEGKIKRGRVNCAINILGGKTQEVLINKRLLKNYLSATKEVKKQFHIKEELHIDTLINLPGVFSLTENKIPHLGIWPHLKTLVNQVVADLVKARQKEGQALCGYLKNRAQFVKANLEMVEARFKKVIKDKLARLKTEEERSGFLKDKDISEETERLAFHIRNFKNRLDKNGPVGKELDFIAQEMQREANTMAAKSCDTAISSRVVQIKSQIEKIREQVQNIE